MSIRKKLQKLLEILERYGNVKIQTLGTDALRDIIRQYDREHRVTGLEKKDRFRKGFLAGMGTTVVLIGLLTIAYVVVF